METFLCEEARDHGVSSPYPTRVDKSRSIEYTVGVHPWRASDEALFKLACASVLLEISSSHHIDPYNASQLNKEAQAH
jgi:hypothetical protein